MAKHVLFEFQIELQKQSCELHLERIKFSGFFNPSCPRAMEGPKKRHRSKSAPESSANKRPSALRKPSTSSSTSPSARMRDFLAEKKKDRASSTASASKSVRREKKGQKVRKGDKFSKTNEKEKARKAEVQKEKAGKAEVEKEKARKAEAEKEKARRAEVQKQKARKAEVQGKARKDEAEKEKAKKAEVQKGKARKAEVEEETRKAEAEKEKASKAEVEEKARKEKEKNRKLEVEKIEKEKARHASVEKQKAKQDKEDAKNEEEKEKKEPPIKFVPSQKSKVEHIFSTPPAKGSPRSVGSLSSRERAEMHLQSLGALLQASDSDESSADNESSECQEGFLEVDEAEKIKEAEKPKTKDAETKEPNDEKNGDESEEEKEEASSETSSNSDMGEEEEEVSEPGSELHSENEEGEELESEEEEAESADEAVEDEETNAAPATDGTGHALAAATKAAEQKSATLRNSTTNKREWDSFCRQLKANNRIPCQVSEYAQTSANKTCLFGMWLDSEKDWTKCQLLLERTLKQQNEAEKGWCAMQGHEIQKKYKNNPERAEKIMKARRDAGLWYPDEDFPDDPTESRLHF